LDHEHDRVSDHMARVELRNRLPRRAPQDPSVEHRQARLRAHFGRARLRRGCELYGLRHGHQNFPTRCSTMGPSATTGKYVSPTTMTTTPVSRPAKSGVVVGNVPADAGTVCLRASEPAIASTGTIKKNRPIS